MAAETERSDVEREQTKAEADVELVRQRAARDRKRLGSGAVLNPKDQENLQHEVESLARRQSALEDVELAVMERLEGIEDRLTQLAARRDEVRAARAAAGSRRDARCAEIDEEAATTRELRGVLAGQIDPALVTLYEKLREQQGGLAVSALRQRRCQGCQLELNTVDLNTIRDAPDDEVLRCEECRRILVRTEESGL